MGVVARGGGHSEPAFGQNWDGDWVPRAHSASPPPGLGQDARSAEAACVWPASLPPRLVDAAAEGGGASLAWPAWLLLETGAEELACFGEPGDAKAARWQGGPMGPTNVRGELAG